jgi:hypothetical protein
MAIALAVGGCTPKVRTVVELAPRTAQDQVRDLRPTPELQELVSELSREASGGAVAGLASEEASEQLSALARELTRAVLVAFQMEASALRPATRELASDVASATVRSVSEEIARSLGPSLRQVLADEVFGRPEVRHAIGQTSREIGRQAVLGSNDALVELAKQRQEGVRPAPLGTAAELLSTTTWLVVLLVVVLLLGIPLLWLVKERIKANRYREETNRRTSIAAGLLRAAQVDDDPTLRKLLAEVAEHLVLDHPGKHPETPSPPSTPPPSAPPPSTGGTLRHA